MTGTSCARVSTGSQSVTPLGVPYEFCERGTFECTGMAGDGTHRQYVGTLSDDTSMALCICSSIKQLAYIDVRDIAGVYYRFEAIPPKWVSQLRGKAVIDQCI